MNVQEAELIHALEMEIVTKSTEHVLVRCITTKGLTVRNALAVGKDNNA